VPNLASMLVRNLVQSSDQNKVIDNTNCLQTYDYQITQQWVQLSGKSHFDHAKQSNSQLSVRLAWHLAPIFSILYFHIVKH
jgi:hypothetical protein